MVSGVHGPVGRHVRLAVVEVHNGENALVKVEPMEGKIVLAIEKSKTSATSRNVQVKTSIRHFVIEVTF